MMESLNGGVLQPHPDMLKAVQIIKSSGLKTALLTNIWTIDEHNSNFVESALPVAPSMFDVVRYFRWSKFHTYKSLS